MGNDLIVAIGLLMIMVGYFVYCMTTPSEIEGSYEDDLEVMPY